jgi:glycosyltransferase involved in cell wall biosynthesis
MAEKKGLLIVSHGYPPYYGGAEHAAGYLAKEANKTGLWDVTVLTSDIGGRLPAKSVEEGVMVIRVKTRKKEWGRHTTPELISFLMSAYKFKPDRPIDYILANCALPAGAVAQTIGRRLNVPYGVILQGSDVPGYQNQRFGIIYDLIKPWLRAIWRRASYVAAVSEPLRQLALAAWPNGNVVVIPNGVDCNKFEPADTRSSPRPVVRLITVAQLIERKGLRYLIEALTLLPESVKSSVALEVCGIGPCEQDLRAQAERAGVGGLIAWSGLLDQESLAERLRASDIFVLPTLQEAWPLSVLEAMASGLPVISTNAGGIPEVVQHDVCGLLVEPSDAEALAKAIARLIEDPNDLTGFGQAAAVRARQWSWDSIWEMHENLINRGSHKD